MRILLIGAHGFIGNAVTERLREKHSLIGVSRHPQGSCHEEIEADLTKEEPSFPEDIDVAFYLIHSMREKKGDFYELEERAAKHFVSAIKKTQCKQIIYVSGLCHGLPTSKHMQSRHNVERILKDSGVPLTIFRSGIILGEGSGSFEIMRDLVEKLPVMICPRWVKSLSQPIYINDVLYYLEHALSNPLCFKRTFEIGGPEQLSYKKMLEIMGEVRGLKRHLITIPLLTPNLSSYWLVFISSASFLLAKNLIESLYQDAICSEHTIHTVIPHTCMGYRETLEQIFAHPKLTHGCYRSKLENTLSFTYKKSRYGEWWVDKNTLIFRPKGLLGRLLYPLLRRYIQCCD